MPDTYEIKVERHTLDSLLGRGELAQCGACGVHVEGESIKDERCFHCQPIPNLRLYRDFPLPLTMLCGCRFAREGQYIAFYHCTPKRIVDTADLHDPDPWENAGDLTGPHIHDWDRPPELVPGPDGKLRCECGEERQA